VDFILAPTARRYNWKLTHCRDFTSHSLLPMAARKAGIPTPALCRQIAEAAWNDFHH
jgi:hypothetical protein